VCFWHRTGIIEGVKIGGALRIYRDSLEKNLYLRRQRPLSQGPKGREDQSCKRSSFILFCCLSGLVSLRIAPSYLVPLRAGWELGESCPSPGNVDGRVYVYRSAQVVRVTDSGRRVGREGPAHRR
jgi:hypothetical protein